MVEPVETTEAVLTGSHLDSVLDGGAYDGPLGVVSALAAVDLLRARGFEPDRPVGVGAFVEEEGSRFGIACLGSRLLTGATSWEQARELRDRDGVRLPDALAAEDLHGPDTGRGLLDGVGCFVELHVEQGRDLVHRDAAVGVASAIWPHGRYRFDFAGEANHAGTTRMEDRRDPMLTYAMTALAANKQARTRGQRATFGRVDVRPNGTNAVPSARHRLARRAGRVRRGARRPARRRRPAGAGACRARRHVVDGDRRVGVRRGALRRRPGRAHRRARATAPVIPTMAGHDAGVLSAAGIPTAMLFVRNPTGVSHCPAEHAETADCLAGVEALADTLALLAGGDR